MLIDGRNFYDQPINDSIRKYDEIRKIATGKGDNYVTGFLLDYGYFKKNYQLIAADLSKQRELDADPKLMKVAMPLAKNVLAPLGLTAAMSAIDGSIQKK